MKQHTNFLPLTLKATVLTTLISSICLVSSLASAQNIYLNQQNLKSQLDWLNAQGVIQISTSTWPLTANEIQRAIDNAQPNNPEQQNVLQTLQDSLDKPSTSGSQLEVNNKIAVYHQSDRQQLPQTFADDKMAEQQLTAQSNISNDSWEINLQTNIKNNDLIKDEDASFEGSYVAGKIANQWLIAGQIPTWWGPGHDGSLIRGDAGQPVLGITMQRDTQTAPNNKLLSWIGPWQYQLFAGQLDDYNAVPDAKLIGMRLTANPTDWLELGASRSIMWGGEGRPESFDSLWDAIKGTKDNGGTGEPDPANQIAGFDARVNLAPLVNAPIGIYGQYVGEDEAGGLPAKNMYLAGIDFASSFTTNDNNGIPYQIYGEWTDTRSTNEVKGVSYNHSNYKDGYYQHGYPLGYALGGDAESIVLGSKLWLNTSNFVNAKLQYAKVNQSARNTNKVFPQSDTLKIADVSWEHQLNPQTSIASRLWLTDSENNNTDVGVGIGVEFSP